MTEFAKKLKLLRNSKGWTQEELAARLNVSRSAVGNYESGIRTPKYEELEEIADLFNCTMSYLLEKDRLGPDEWYDGKEGYYLKEDESHLIDRYRELNLIGKKELDRYTDYLMSRPDCRKESESDASSDAV